MSRTYPPGHAVVICSMTTGALAAGTDSSHSSDEVRRVELVVVITFRTILEVS